MTKKDFEAIARVVFLMDMSPRARLLVARDFRDVLKRANPRFKPAVFMKACGFPLYEGQHTDD